MRPHKILRACAGCALASALLLFGATSYAGTGWYMTVVNNTNQTISVQNSGNDCWYANDLDKNIQIPSNSRQQLYTEMKNSGGCNKFWNGSWIQGFKIMVGNTMVLNASQNGSYDGHFGQCWVAPQAGYSFPQASTGCEESSSTITLEFDVSNTADGGYMASVPSIRCTGSIQCSMAKEEQAKSH